MRRCYTSCCTSLRAFCCLLGARCRTQRYCAQRGNLGLQLRKVLVVSVALLFDLELLLLDDRCEPPQALTQLVDLSTVVCCLLGHGLGHGSPPSRCDLTPPLTAFDEAG